MENAEISQIVRLSIPYFSSRERYLLVYKKNNVDYILLSITGRDKKEDKDNKKETKKVDRKIAQQELTFILPDHSGGSLINLNTLVIIERDFFFEFLRRVKQPEEKIQLSKEEFKKIDREVNGCFANKSFWGNLYRLRLLPDNDKKTLMIIS